ncbi:MAG: hypothetical protein GF313_16830 [Caldithrix sp.]|nr:hypothetical protein [Caldithrix sp.]
MIKPFLWGRQIVFLVFFAAFMIIIHSCDSRKRKDVLARVGNKTITIKDFKNLYAFNPHLARISQKNTARKLMLSTLIAEQILAQEVDLQKSTMRDSLQDMGAQYEREALIEKFWQDVIMKEVTVNDDELFETYKQSKTRKVIVYLIYPDKQSAQAAYRQYQAGVTFNELAEAMNLPATALPIDTVSMEFQLPFFEQAVLNLEIGQVSEPLKVNQRYYLVKCIGQQVEAGLSRSEFQKQRQKLAKQLRRFKGQQVFIRYRQENLPAEPYHLNRSVFKKMVQILEPQAVQDHSTGLQSNANQSMDRAFVSSELWPESLMNETVATFADGRSLSVEALGKRLALAPYPLLTESKAQFRASVIKAVKNILDDELIASEARKYGLHKTKDVQRQKSMWMDYARFRTGIRQIVPDSLSGERANRMVESWLLQKLPEYDIEVNALMLDTLTVHRTDMVSIKQHFPGRTIAPIIQPLMSFDRWHAKMNTYFEQ